MDGLQASVEKMRREGLPEPAIATFEHYYRQLAEGETGMIPESEIEPVEDPQELDALPEGDAALDEAVVLKLNGGLGTSMGMTRAKSLIEAKDGMSFLDVIARQVLELRRAVGRADPARAHELVRDARRLAARRSTPRRAPTCRRTSCSTRSRSCGPTT